MSNVLKLMQKLVFIVSLCVCLSYAGAFTPFHASSEPFLLLLSGAAIFAVATTVKRTSSRGQAGRKESGLR
jgi:hypothetical protein